MKVLITSIWPYPHTGGISSHISLLEKTLRKKGHRGNVVTLSEEDLTAFLDRRIARLASRIPASPARNASLSLNASLPVAHEVNKVWLAAMIEDELATFRYDVVHCHDVLSCLAASPACRKKGIPLVLTVHGYLAREAVASGAVSSGTWEESYLEGNEREGYRAADAIAAVDSALRKHVAELLGDGSPGAAAGKQEIFLIHNAVDLDEFAGSTKVRAEARKILGFSGEDFVLLCPRRLTAKNGVRYPLPALKILRERNPHRNILLVYAGDGEERDAIVNEACSSGLRDSVAILPSVEHEKMPWLYAASDVVLIPSATSAGVVEATSIALLEAMASGVPVVASAIGGIAEIVKDGVSGLLVPERDPEAIAAAVQRIIDEPELGGRLAENAKTQVMERHSPDVWWRSVERLYESARERRDRIR